MIPSIPRVLTVVALASIALACIVGCGVSDYERQMDKQRQRIQEFDDTNRLLDDPIENPLMPAAGVKAEAPAWPFEFFLRLPKGYALVPREKDDKALVVTPFPLLRYSSSEAGSSLFVAAAIVPKTKDDKANEATERFRTLVRLALEAYYAKAIGVKLAFPDKLPIQSIEVTRFVTNSAAPEGRVAYDVITYTDKHNILAKQHVAFQAYFHKDGDRHVCIVAHRPLATIADPAFRKGLEACLGTLDLSNEASGRRSQFLRAKRR